DRFPLTSRTHHVAVHQRRRNPPAIAPPPRPLRFATGAVFLLSAAPGRRVVPSRGGGRGAGLGIPLARRPRRLYSDPVIRGAAVRLSLAPHAGDHTAPHTRATG